MLDVTWIAPVVPGLPVLTVLDELGRLGKINDVQIKTATGNVLLALLLLYVVFTNDDCA